MRNVAPGGSTKNDKRLEAGFRYNFDRCPQLAQSSNWPDVANRITSSISKVRYWMTAILM
jgi:hypothetical protein